MKYLPMVDGVTVCVLTTRPLTTSTYTSINNNKNVKNFVSLTKSINVTKTQIIDELFN